MRVRTGHGPDDWHDAGPQTVRLTTVAYSSVHALNVGQMAPVLSPGGIPQTPVEAARRRRRSEAQKAERRACGAVMPQAGERCARAPGHGYGCRTRLALDDMASSRRAPIL